MAAWITTRDVVLTLIQEEKRPPTWRWNATARHDDLVPGLWEWQADACQQATMLAKELIHIEEEARWRWPTEQTVAAADDEWWKRQP